MCRPAQVLRRLALAGFLAFCSAAVYATPIINGTFHFRDQRSANSVGFFIGDRLTFGATSVVPSGPGTNVSGTNPEFSGTRNLVHFPTGSFPDQYSNSVAYDPNIASNIWTLTADDGVGSPSVATTPSPGTATATPFIASFSLSNPGATPTFNWSVPASSTHNSQSIGIYDLEDALDSNGNPPQIFQTTSLSNAARSFDVSALAPGLLLPNHQYSVAVQLDDRTPGGRLLSRSRSFFDFVTSDIVVPGTGPVFLPSVDPTGNPTGGPVYHFNVGEVIAGETIFIDPFIAIGYEFEKGVNDENFASVILPDIGDGLFSLSFLDGANTIAVDLPAETVFAFPTGGVSAFTVTGIETSAGLDPNDATAFVTGLSFVANSTFTGTMTPITVFVAASVPTPSTTALLALGLLGLGWRRRTH